MVTSVDGFHLKEAFGTLVIHFDLVITLIAKLDGGVIRADHTLGYRTALTSVRRN